MSAPNPEAWRLTDEIWASFEDWASRFGLGDRVKRRRQIEQHLKFHPDSAVIFDRAEGSDWGEWCKIATRTSEVLAGELVDVSEARCRAGGCEEGFGGHTPDCRSFTLHLAICDARRGSLSVERFTDLTADNRPRKGKE
jgi:hypothetical protein